MKTRDGINIAYHLYGPQDGPVLVLIHGLGADYRMWTPQIERWPLEGYRLIVPDMRSHGDSDHVRSLTLQDWVEDIREILDREGVESATMIGVSMGGVIAQSFALAYQSRLERLVLSDTFHQLASLSHKLIGAATVATFRLYKLFGKERLAAALSSSYKDPAVREYFQNAVAKTDLDQLILARKAINTIDVARRLAELSIPTLVLVGEDFGPHFVKISADLAECIPGARLAVIKDAQDPSNLVNPDSFDREVLFFLEKTAGAS